IPRHVLRTQRHSPLPNRGYRAPAVRKPTYNPHGSGVQRPGCPENYRDSQGVDYRRAAACVVVVFSSHSARPSGGAPQLRSDARTVPAGVPEAAASRYGCSPDASRTSCATTTAPLSRILARCALPAVDVEQRNQGTLAGEIRQRGVTWSGTHSLL